MPRPERFTAAEVRSGVMRTLGTKAVSTPRRTTHGFGNENWLFAVDGENLLIKITPLEGHPVDKLMAAATASRMAEAAGVPVPQEVFLSAQCEAFGGAFTRIQQYLPGYHPDQVLHSPEAVARFFASLGEVVGRLHVIRCEAFASRVGGEPRFSSWQRYLEYRLPQVAARSRALDAYDEHFLRATIERLLAAAEGVSPSIQPRLCHRDLTMDNVLVDEHGDVAALLDFDLAEPWDRAVDMVKLNWLAFPAYPGAERAYRRQYFVEADEPQQWADRVWVASVMELLNLVPNAIGAGDPSFGTSARRRLHEVLRSGP